MVWGMTRLLRYAAAVVLVGGATAVLSACTSDPEPIVTQTPSPTATVAMTPSPSPTPTLTPEEELLAQIPEDARSEDFASATQFARFFIELYPGLFAPEPDTEVFAFLSTQDCEFCAGALESSVATEEAGAHSEGGDFAWPDALATGGLGEDDFWYVSQRFSVTDTITYLADGSVHKTVRGGTGDVALKLALEEGAWRVHGVEFNYDDE